jgi:hypothetical protein
MKKNTYNRKDDTLLDYVSCKIVEKKIKQKGNFKETRELLNQRDKDELVSTVLALMEIISDLSYIKIQPTEKE